MSALSEHISIWGELADVDHVLRHVDVGGVRTRVLQAGTTGPDLVLLHGWGMHSGAWAEEIPVLARGHRVHAIDLPGHGHSGTEHPGSFDDAADAIARHMPEGSVACGWSGQEC